MINEPESAAGGEGGEDDAFGEPGVIHVSPQDKEAIERVSSGFEWFFIVWESIFRPILPLWYGVKITIRHTMAYSLLNKANECVSKILKKLMICGENTYLLSCDKSKINYSKWT